MRGIVLGLVAVCLLANSAATLTTDDYPKLIVGTWEIAYSDAKTIPIGTKLEFTADGKLKLSFNRDGKDPIEQAIGYRVEKDVFILTGKDGTKNDKGRICLLNKSSFVLNDETEDKLLVLKRVKK